MNTTLQRRRRAERRFRWAGRLALWLAVGALFLLLGTIMWQARNAFFQTHIRLSVTFDAALLDRNGDAMPDASANYRRVLSAALTDTLQALEPTDADGRAAALTPRIMTQMLSRRAAFDLRDALQRHPQWLGTTQEIWLTAATPVDMHRKGTLAEGATRLFSAQHAELAQALTQAGRLELRWNTALFTQADSREPENAGILGGLIGSLFTIACCMAVALPLGVLCAVYLEEFAPKNRWSEWIEININNLAAVPSIVFGLLGLSLYILVFGMPRSSALVGGLTLALLVLPVIIIASRAALRAVPPSIRDAARALGASPLQVVLHHVVPLAVPGIMTGSILAVARALGETAPLLMIGMVAFIANAPSGITDAATTMPVQVFLWADSPEPAFRERTSAAILILLALLLSLNALAIWLRRRYEQRW